MKKYQAQLEYYTMDVNCTVHPLAVLRPVLKTKNFTTASELRKFPPARFVRVAGLLVMLHTPPTRSGKRIMFVTIEDETGLIDLTIFPDVQRHWAKEILRSEILAIEGVLKKEGVANRSISIICRRILDDLTGPVPRVFQRFSARGGALSR